MICKIIIIVLSVVTPNLSFEFKKCKLPDPVCMRESAQDLLKSFGDGIPEYNVERMDPYTKDRIDLSTPNLMTVFKNITLTGLKTCKINKLNLENLKLLAQAECDLMIESDYEMDGKVLILSIQGNGKARIGLKKLVVSIDGNWTEVVGKDGKKHWKVKSYTRSYDLKGKSSIRLDNMFNGNQALGRVVNELFDSNPNDVILEMAPPFVDFISKLCLDNVSRFLRALPIEDLVL